MKFPRLASNLRRHRCYCSLLLPATWIQFILNLWLFAAFVKWIFSLSLILRVEILTIFLLLFILDSNGILSNMANCNCHGWSFTNMAKSVYSATNTSDKWWSFCYCHCTFKFTGFSATGIFFQIIFLTQNFLILNHLKNRLMHIQMDTYKQDFLNLIRVIVAQHLHTVHQPFNDMSFKHNKLHP